MAMHVAVVGCPRPFVSSWRELKTRASETYCADGSRCRLAPHPIRIRRRKLPRRCLGSVSHVSVEMALPRGRPAHAFCPLKRSVGSRGNATPVAACTLVRRPRVASAPVKNESTVSEVEGTVARTYVEI